MTNTTVQICTAIHREMKNAIIQYDHRTNVAVDKVVRRLHGRSFTATWQGWRIPFRTDYKEYLQNELKETGAEIIFGENPIPPKVAEDKQTKKADQKQSKPIIHRDKSKIKTNENTNTQKPTVILQKNEILSVNHNLPSSIDAENTNNSAKYAKIVTRIDLPNKRFFVTHPFSQQLFDEFREIKNGFRQKIGKQWIFKGDNKIYTKVCNIAKKYGYAIEKQYEKTLLEKETNPTVRLFIEALTIKNYSHSTIESYLPYFKQFVEQFTTYKLENLTYTQLRNY